MSMNILSIKISYKNAIITHSHRSSCPMSSLLHTKRRIALSAHVNRQYCNIMLTHTNLIRFATLLYFPQWLNQCGKTQYGRCSLVIKSHSHSSHSLISVRRSADHTESWPTSKNAVHYRSCSWNKVGHFISRKFLQQREKVQLAWM